MTNIEFPLVVAGRCPWKSAIAFSLYRATHYLRVNRAPVEKDAIFASWHRTPSGIAWGLSKAPRYGGIYLGTWDLNGNKLEPPPDVQELQDKIQKLEEQLAALELEVYNLRNKSIP